MHSHRLAVLVAALVSGAPLSAQTTPSRMDVPVRTVMLFSSGVGYFEHAGSVRGDGSAELRFRTSQINDILKSLVLQDLDGGFVRTVAYGAQDPVEKTLLSFRVDITANPGLAALLNQLRGERITVRAEGDTLSGVILGVETMRKTRVGVGSYETSVLNLLQGATIRSIDLPFVTSFSLGDAKLQADLTRALTALTQARDRDKKPVTISFTGSGERRVRIGYVVETPVWKTSYRLILSDTTSRIQGWAIVENQTDTDWNDVTLSLVSGRPVSFMMDLYRPVYAARPTVAQEMFGGLRPQTYDGGISSIGERVPLSTQPSSQQPPGPQRLAPVRIQAQSTPLIEQGVVGSTTTITQQAINAVPEMTRSFNEAAALQQIDAAASVRAAATTAKLGELFQYSVPNVTLARQTSAMLPIVADRIAAERVSIYNADVLAQHPLNGILLTNTTGKHLLQGPVTVLDGNGYAGDARIGNLPSGQTRLISYGIDLNIVVNNSKQTQNYSIVSGKLQKGVLTIERRFVATREYLIDNQGDTDKTVVIEHPVRRGWQVAGTNQPFETTHEVHRFRGTAVKRTITALVVHEEAVHTSQVSLPAVYMPELVGYSRTPEISPPVREALERVINLRHTLAETEGVIGDYTQQAEGIRSEQSRLRENMRAVGQSTPYYKRLLAKLNEQESQIERLQSQIAELRTRRDSQQKALNEYVASLTLS